MEAALQQSPLQQSTQEVSRPLPGQIIISALVLEASGTGNIPSFNVSNAGNAPVVSTIIVTPHFSNAGVTCDGPTKTFTITVNPTGEVDQPVSQIICNGANTTSVNFTTVNTGGVTTYTWTNNNISIGLVASGSGNIPSFVATNAGNAPVIATIIVTPHFSNGGKICDGPTKTLPFQSTRHHR